MRIFAVILCLFIVQLAIILGSEYRRPQRAVAWLCITFCCPPLGLLFYYFLGRDYWQSRKLGTRCVSLLREIRAHITGKIHRVKNVEETGNPGFVDRPELLHLLNGLAESHVTQYNRCEVLSGAQEAYKSMLEAMEGAHEHIHMEFYIFREDGIGRRFQELMIRKARQGVRVRLLCDGLGSHKLSRSFVNTLRNAGVQVHFFLPPLTALPDRRFNFRNHRKILVVDGLAGFTGGMNIGDDYLGKNPKMGEWRDTHLRLEGDAVYQLQYVFLKDWRLVTGDVLSHPRFFPDHACSGREAVQIVAGGPDGAIDVTQEMYFASICAAKQRVWMTSPYFIPDPAVCRALKNAVLSGVDVRIIIPAKPDNRLVYYATLSYLENLQDAGVKFYRYTAGFMHAKVMIIDSLLATVGSANLDMRSFYSNFELTAVLLQPEVIAELAEDFSRDLKHSEYIDPIKFRERGRNVKRIESLCQLLSPLL
ncbi:cardiolipin synthase [Paenibacillus tritici]|uniref:Cardiolipin synthase n=1 Tax=Paenibacillus tritici TaxID=1873425 RepID=A0ABX2DS27_9BACL|nr:cardiolipin synthase [Paenibacillus tritici]NQX47392.1 cardiolipin synthase [Paenibacillus tritici]QUL55938.1 cardiolipin synthase [Paenibacillus tritici]